MRCQLSDGESTVVAMMNKQVYDKMEDVIINFAVIQVFTFMKQSVKDKTILVLTKPPKVVYPKLQVKIGEGRDYADNLKSKFFDSEPNVLSTLIPKQVSDSDKGIQDLNTQDPEAT